MRWIVVGADRSVDAICATSSHAASAISSPCAESPPHWRKICVRFAWYETSRRLAPPRPSRSCARRPRVMWTMHWAALGAGCHVLVEKPLADAVDRVDELRTAAHAAGRTVGVAHCFRFHALLKLVRQELVVPGGSAVRGRRGSGAASISPTGGPVATTARRTVRAVKRVEACSWTSSTSSTTATGSSVR